MIKIKEKAGFDGVRYRCKDCGKYCFTVACKESPWYIESECCGYLVDVA